MLTLDDDPGTITDDAAADSESIPVAPSVPYVVVPFVVLLSPGQYNYDITGITIGVLVYYLFIYVSPAIK